jgi:tetratricopeptide (TPR) repeat protein
LSKDINPILSGWDHDAEEFQVRIVAGLDGRDKLQRRLDLGLIQMELSGRPDGHRPFGHESLLDYHEAKALESKAPDDYPLDTDACADLMREGVQYYQRYLAAYHLRRFDLVARDTSRNLRLFAFAVKHAVDRRDKVQFDQYRPYVTMMKARALGAEAMARDDHAAALRFLDEGIEAIRAFLREYDQDEDQFHCRELTKLLRIRREVEQSRPVGPAQRLEQQLELAVALEDYEEAARIRDQIARLKGVPSAADPKASRLF